MAGGSSGGLQDAIKQMGSGKTNSIWDQNQGTPWYLNPWYAGGSHFNPGSGAQAGAQPPVQAAAPQAPPTAQAQAPWMSQLGGMGQQLMNRGTPPPIHPMAHNMPGPGPGLMQMPQPLTPTQVNQALINHTGLFGRGGLG